MAVVGPGADMYDIIFDPTRGFLGPYDKAAPSGRKFTSEKFRPNLEKLMASIVAYAQYKAKKYKEKSPSKDLEELMSSLEAKRGLFKERRNAGNAETFSEDAYKYMENESVKKSTEDYSTILTNLSKFRAKETANTKIETGICQYLAMNEREKLTFREKLGETIAKAIENLRSEVSGESTSARATRRQIEQFLIDFANSWKSFQDSYVLNFCLTGGAGVGKTTLAKAISRCFSAFGILATDYIKEANKTDFIGKYIGQTVAKTQDTLYSSLEGVCFIDEAYAVGQVEEFGQEFLDELTFFTQKFPGCICIIVAGYEKEMNKHFFDKNEGLNRRFPNRVDLKPYDIATIKNTVVSRIIRKLGVPPKDHEKVRNSLKYHLALLDMLYMDMHQSADDYEAGYDSFFSTNLDTLLINLYVGTNSAQKRNILKTYVLKKWFNIPEGDLFPNQMGDVQNIVDKILRLQPVIESGSVTFQNAIDTMNSYFEIRKSARILGEDQDGRIKISFTLPSLSPSDFQTNILEILLKTMMDEGSAGQSVNHEKLSVAYTTAVRELQAYQNRVLEGKEVVKLSTHVDVGFLKQESEVLERLGPEGLLPYTSDGAVKLDSSLSAVMAGTFPTIPQQTLRDVCATQAGAAPAKPVEYYDDGAASAGQGPVGAGAGVPSGAPPPPVPSPPAPSPPVPSPAVPSSPVPSPPTLPAGNGASSAAPAENSPRIINFREAPNSGVGVIQAPNGNGKRYLAVFFQKKEGSDRSWNLSSLSTGDTLGSFTGSAPGQGEDILAIAMSDDERVWSVMGNLEGAITFKPVNEAGPPLGNSEETIRDMLTTYFRSQGAPAELPRIPGSSAGILFDGAYYFPLYLTQTNAFTYSVKLEKGQQGSSAELILLYTETNLNSQPEQANVKYQDINTEQWYWAIVKPTAFRIGEFMPGSPSFKGVGTHLEAIERYRFWERKGGRRRWKTRKQIHKKKRKTRMKKH